MHRFISVGSRPQLEPVSKARRPAPQVGAELRAVPSLLTGLQALMVSGDADLRAVITAMLEQCGAKVTAVASADEAIDTLIAVRLDILISDIATSDDNSHPLIRRVRALAPEHGGRIPAVALTAYAQQRAPQCAFSVGYQIHVPKTARGADLILMLAILVGRTGNCQKLYPKDA